MIATLEIKEAKKRSAQPKEERTTTKARAKNGFSSKAALLHPACSPPPAPDAPRRSKDDPRRLSDMIFERIIGPFCPLLSRQSATLDIQNQRHPFPPSPLHDLLGYYTAGCHRRPESKELGRFKPGASTLSFFKNCE